QGAAASPRAEPPPAAGDRRPRELLDEHVPGRPQGAEAPLPASLLARGPAGRSRRAQAATPLNRARPEPEMDRMGAAFTPAVRNTQGGEQWRPTRLAVPGSPSTRTVLSSARHGRRKPASARAWRRSRTRRK